MTAFIITWLVLRKTISWVRGIAVAFMSMPHNAFKISVEKNPFDAKSIARREVSSRGILSSRKDKNCVEANVWKLRPNVQKP